MVEYRKAVAEDLPLLLELQNANLISNLGVHNAHDGYLSGGFTLEELFKMNDDIGIVVGFDGAQLAGAFGLSNPEWNLRFPLVGTMVAKYPTIQWRGKMLNLYHSYVAGPIVVEASHRGTGVFEALYSCADKLFGSKFDVGVTMISEKNHRSLNAHLKVGFEEADRFAFRDTDYIILLRAPT